ncbi:MAG: hypothetical protein ABWW66_05315 [Archaeoglobaceae archaeon]
MPTSSELGGVILQALAELLRLLKTLFLQLQIVGNNETAVNASRGPYQSFWEIWYSSGAMLNWMTKMLTREHGFVWIINYNETLREKFREVVATAAKNATAMLGDVYGNNSTTFLLKVMAKEVTNESNHVFVANLWSSLAELVRLVSDALQHFPSYFP